MSEERKNSLIWGGMLFVCALGCASLRNHPALGISPLAIGFIEALIYICIMMGVRLSDWRWSAAIAVATPIYLWTMQFLDAFMIPIDILVNLTLVGCMAVVLKFRKGWFASLLMLTLPTFAMLLLSEAVALWIVKEEGLMRAMVVAWNISLYSGLSLLGAAAVCIPGRKKTEAHPE